MQFHQMYDHVLAELEFGRIEAGINLLVGILDAAESAESETSHAHAALQAHPLNAMLLEDPLCADAQLRPDNAAHRVNMLRSGSFGIQVSSTGHRLFAASRNIAFARALSSRHEHAKQKLCRAWQQGLNIWLIADAQHNLLESLRNMDTSNICISSENDLIGAAGKDDISEQKFDLIFAPHLPDKLSAPRLKDIIQKLKIQLTQSGVLAMSSLLPGHPGTGWRRACFGWDPACHDDEELAAMATSGFISNRYHDDTGCVAWVELRKF